MSGLAHEQPPAVGQRCILNVDDVNRPTGVWFGIVESVEQKGTAPNTWYDVKARITGPITADTDPANPFYGTVGSKEFGCVPNVNYEVFTDSYTARKFLITRLLERNALLKDLETVRIQRNELRELFKSMAPLKAASATNSTK